MWSAAIFVAAVAVCSFLDLRAFNYFEQYTYNVRLTVYGKRNGNLTEQARKQIVLVPLSDESFKQLPGPPVPRDYHAKVIRDLTRAGAKVIAFDLLFDLDRPQDRVFAAAARASGKVLWACTQDASGKLILPTAQLRQASPHYGHILMPQNADLMTIDRLEAVIMHNGRPVSAFSLKAALMALGLENLPMRRVAQGWQIGNLTLPVDEKGYLRISYLGKPDETFPVVPYEQIAGGAVDDEFYRKNQFFRDRIVLIGDNTTVGNDHRFTSVGDMWGVEIHAHAIATLLQRGFVRETPQWVNLIAVCLLAAMVCPFVTVCRLQWAACATVGLLVGYFVFNVWLFVDCGVWLHLIAPSTAIFLVAAGVLLDRGLIEEREKKRAYGLLRRFLSPQSAEYVITNPDKCVLGGERVTATVMFADVRGFTTMSEKLLPEQVVALLNDYLQAMTNIVFKHEGTVDKYVGDCIMALFGIPVPYPDHARRAVAAAIEMQNALLTLHEKRQAEGLPPLDMGVGINTGEMVFGMMGADERWDFTVIGDAVNLAARVEGLNAEMNSCILITESTYELVKDDVEVWGPLIAHVKGKQEEVVVYGVFGWRDASVEISDATPVQESVVTS